MKPVQKMALSLLFTVVIFSAFAVLAYSGLFKLIEARFYNQRVTLQYENDLESAIARIEEYNTKNREAFTTFIKADYTARSFLPNQSQEDIDKRKRTLDYLKEEFPGFLYLRLIDEKGNIHFTTLQDDIAKQTAFSLTYKRIEDVEPQALRDVLVLTQDDGEKYVLDEAGGRIIYVFPFYDMLGIFKGSAAFYVAPKDLKNDLIRNNILEVGQDFSILDNTGFILYADLLADQSLKQEIGRIWREPEAGPFKSGTDKTRLTESVTGTSYILLSEKSPGGAYVGFVLPSHLFELNSYLRIILMASIFLTLFLVSFLLLSLKQDRALLLAERVKRFQLNFLREYIENKEQIDWTRWKMEISAKKDAIRNEIKRGIGKIPEKRATLVDSLIDRSWDEILGILEHRVQPLHQAGETQDRLTLSGKVEIENLEQIIERVLKKQPLTVTTVVPPVARETVKHVKPEPVSELPGMEEVEELYSIEEVTEISEEPETGQGPLPPSLIIKGAETTETAAPVEDFEAEELEELEEFEELLETDSVEMTETVEGPEALEEAAPETPLEIYEEQPVTDLSGFERTVPVKTGEPEEAEEIEELEELEELSELEEVPEAKEPVTAKTAVPVEAERAVNVSASILVEEVEAEQEEAAEILGDAVEEEPEDVEEETALLPFEVEEPEEEKVSEVPTSDVEEIPVEEPGSLEEPDGNGAEELETLEPEGEFPFDEFQTRIIKLPPLHQERLEELETVADISAQSREVFLEMVSGDFSFFRPFSANTYPVSGKGEGEMAEDEDLEDLEELVDEVPEEAPLPFESMVKRLEGNAELQVMHLQQLKEIFAEKESVIEFTDGVYRIKDELYSRQRGTADGELSKLAQDVLENESPEPADEFDEAESAGSIGDLFMESAEIDLGLHEGGLKETAAVEDKNASPGKITDTGFNFHLYAQQFDETGFNVMKSLMQLSRILGAISIGILSRSSSNQDSDQNVLGLEVAIGLDDDSRQSFGIRGDSPLYMRFLEKRNVLLVKKPGLMLPEFNPGFSVQDSDHIGAYVLLPVQLNLVDGYLFAGLKSREISLADFIVKLKNLVF